MSDTDRARQNSEYVRRLLKNKWPDYAAVLERVVAELMCACDAMHPADVAAMAADRAAMAAVDPAGDFSFA